MPTCAKERENSFARTGNRTHRRSGYPSCMKWAKQLAASVAGGVAGP